MDGKIIVSFRKYLLNFVNPSGTSRGILRHKSSWFIEISDRKGSGVGECSIIEGLSPDFINEIQYVSVLNETCTKLQKLLNNIDKIEFSYSNYQFLNFEFVLEILPHLNFDLYLIITFLDRELQFLLTV